MEQHYGLIVFVHVVSANIFALTLLIMQYAVGPAMGKLPGTPEKEGAAGLLQGRWHPVVDTAIILLSATGVMLMAMRWHLIGVTPLLHWKTSFGIIALLLANTLHFYYRPYKKRLKAAGKTERLQDVNRLTGKMEKAALVFGLAAYLSGISYNHFPF